jgi:hypothetical protein
MREPASVVIQEIAQLGRQRGAFAQPVGQRRRHVFGDVTATRPWTGCAGTAPPGEDPGLSAGHRRARSGGTAGRWIAGPGGCLPGPPPDGGGAILASASRASRPYRTPSSGASSLPGARRDPVPSGRRGAAGLALLQVRARPSSVTAPPAGAWSLRMSALASSWPGAGAACSGGSAPVPASSRAGAPPPRARPARQPARQRRNRQTRSR